MKIILPVHYFPPVYKGGAEQYSFSLARSLIEKGHNVKVISVETLNRVGGPPLVSEHDKYAGVEVYRLSLPEHEDKNFLHSFNNPFVGEWFTNFLRANQPDVVHFQGAYRLSASIISSARQLNLPTVLTLHDYWFVCPRLTLLRSDGLLCNGPQQRIDCVRCCGQAESADGRYIEEWMAEDPALLEPLMGQRQEFLLEQLLSVDALISPSKFLRAIHLQLGVPEHKIQVVPFGMSEAKRQSGLQEKPKGPIRIAYTGHLHTHKGGRVLVEALLRMSDVQTKISAKIFGDQSANEDFVCLLKNMAKGEEYIQFPGGFEPWQLPDILENTDVVVVPSLWYENSPLVILQALKSGVPIVASDVYPLRELIAHNFNGLLFERGNAKALELQLRRLVDEPGLLYDLTRHAFYKRTPASEIEDLEGVYQNVISKRERVAGTTLS